MKELYKRLKSKLCTFNHVCEVGVYLPETSNIVDFIKEGVRASLVEADLDIIPKIKGYFKGYNVTIYPVATWDYHGKLKLSRAASSTFVTDLKASPAIINDNFKKEQNSFFEVECCKFSDIDDGTIDLLSIDIEGSEWYVLKHMISRPKVLSIETHGKLYINPFMKEIEGWIQANNYTIWYKDKSDSIYIKNNLFKIDLFEKINLLLREVMINFRRKKLEIKRLFK
ncbi:FkbM family methyltransferase [Larkinella sp. VNQ87]|uniref:FkbM family methyltransferase n=1 Tax=Larkinella sp. VNQ87 TaxID=3400921 RepID=UPI003C092EDE